MATDIRTVALVRAGLLPYQPAWDWQRQLASERGRGLRGDTLLLLQHPHTFTLGRTARREHLLLPPDQLASLGIDLVESDRGGDITYHGPGQLVGYPILKLARHGGDVARYLRMLEEVLIRTLARYDLAAGRIPGLTGVWVGDAKIAAIGVKLSAAGVTTHGCALNVAPDLAMFERIVPCGIRDRGVTSLAQLLPAAPALDQVAADLVGEFCTVFDVTISDAGEAGPALPHIP